MENNKIMFETPEQIKDYFVNLIKSGKKVKDEEIIKTCQAIDMSDEEMADLIDEILSIDDQDIDFTGEDEMNVDSSTSTVMPLSALQTTSRFLSIVITDEAMRLSMLTSTESLTSFEA